LPELGNENRTLFKKQIKDHTGKLVALMEQASGESINTEVLNRACFANKLLEGSTRMLGLNDWSETLTLFRELLEKVNNEGVHWDENQSQVVSEILEIEERIGDSLSSEDFDNKWTPALFIGVKKEIEVLIEECKGSLQSGPSSEKTNLGKDSVYIEELPKKSGKTDINVFEKLIALLEELCRDFDSCIKNGDGWDERVEDFELKYEESKFYMNLMGDFIQRIADKKDQSSVEITSNLVVGGVRNIVDIYSKMKGWEINFHTNTDEFTMSGRAASAIVKIMKNCLFDISLLSVMDSNDNLMMEMDIACKGSYLEVVVRDNYARYLSDSEIDHEDPAAFYKGLLVIRNILKDWGGLLWVEPGKGKEGRFKFTFPRTPDKIDYYIIDVSGKEIGIPSRCMEGIYEFDPEKIVLEGGEYYLNSSDKKVPVFGMSELASEEINPGDEKNYIIVIGSAEERIGIFTKDCGYKLESISGQLVEEKWATISNYSLQMGERDCAVLDVPLLFSRIKYLRGLETAFEGSGSVAIERA